MKGGRSTMLHKKVMRARELELALIELNEKESILKKEIAELEPVVKPKKRLFGLGKKDTDEFEISQAKSRYNVAAQDLSYVQDSIYTKSNELESLKESKEAFTQLYEKRLFMIKHSPELKEQFEQLEKDYLTSLKRKELLPKASEKAWRIQFEIQNILLILRQAAEAYSANAASNYSPYSKFERIDKAKEETETLRKMLGEFQELLQEMNLKFEMQFDTESFVSYASEGNTSAWTDSRFLSLQVGERVKETLKEFEEKEIQIDNFRKELVDMEKNALKDLYEKQNRLEIFVMK